MELTADERRVLLLVAAAGSGGTGTDAVSARLQAQGKGVGTTFVGPFSGPWYGLREIAGRLAEAGLATIDTDAAPAEGDGGASVADAVHLTVTARGREVASALRAEPNA